MDADTRHQLKQNELAEALGKMRDLTNRETLMWIALIVLVILVYAAYRYRAYAQVSAEAAACQQLRNLTSQVADPAMGDAPLAQLRDLIANVAGSPLEGLARLQLGEGLEARAKHDGGDELFKEAAQQYEAVVKLAAAPASVRAAAAYRLGLVYESLRKFDEARSAYESVKRNPAYAGTPYPDMAAGRLEQLDDFARPVKFLPGVKPLPTTQPTTQATSQPSIQAAPASQPPADHSTGAQKPADTQTP